MSREIEDWIIELNAAREFRRRFGKEAKWKSLEELFYNEHESQIMEGPNLILSNGDALLSALNVPNPSITIKAKRMESLEKARVLERIDEGLMIDMNVKQEMEMAILHAFLHGKGVLKVGFDSEYGYDPELDVLNGQGGFTLSQFDRKGNRIEFGNTSPGMPWVAAVHPRDFLVPWGTVFLDKAPWCAHRCVRHIDDLRADPKYSNTKALEPSVSMESYVNSYFSTEGEILHSATSYLQSGFWTKNPEYIEFWEIHDRRTGEVLCLVPDHDRFIRKEKDLLQVDGLPFIDVSFTPRSRAFWVTPEAHYLIKQQAELSDISLQASKQRRISILKFLFNKGLIEEGEMNKILSADVGAGAAVDGGIDDIRKAVYAFTAFNNNQQLQLDAEFVRRNARELVGFSRNQAGEFDTSSRRTATEAMVVDRAASTRVSRKSAALGDAYKKIFRKVNLLVTLYWRMPRIVDLIGEDGTPQWLSVQGKDLWGDYFYEVGFSDEGEPSKEARRMFALNLFATLSQDPTVDQIGLRRFLIRNFNDPEFASIYKPEVLAQGQLMQGQGIVNALQQGQGQ